MAGQPKRAFSAAIVGAGFGGVGAAIRLVKAGITDITLFAVMVLAGYGIPTTILVLLAMSPLTSTPFRSRPVHNGRADMRLRLI